MDQKLQDEVVILAITAWAETIRMRHALAPFARTAAAHGFRKDKDDLWVSSGVDDLWIPRKLPPPVYVPLSHIPCPPGFRP